MSEAKEAVKSAAAWTPQKLSTAISKKQIAPLYFLYGDETYLIERSLVELVQCALGDGLRDFNFNSYYAQEVDPSTLRDAVETLPMMARSRVIVLKDADAMSDKAWESLSPLFEAPVETSTFICIGTKIDKRKKFFKRFIENGVVVEFKRPYDNQIPDWIRQIAAQNGLSLSNACVDLIHQLVGSNLQDLANEIKKLAEYSGAKKTVSEEEVVKLVSHSRIDSVFDLTDAIATNDLARALNCLVNLLDHGQSEVGILALISRHVRILKLINDGLKEGLSGQRLSSRAGVAPYFLKSYVDQARTWNERKIEKTFQALLDTDRALKSSPVASHIWLENFILQTCTA